MKTKYFYLVPMILGIFALVGCTSTEVTEIEEIAEEITEEIEEAVELEASQVYVNEYYNFSIEIPPGPYVLPNNPDDSEYFLIGNENPFTEMSINVKDGSLESGYELSGGTLLSEEDIEINGVKGKLLHYGYYLPGETEPVEGGGCPYYVLDNEQGQLVTFGLWECLNSPIFEDVVYSFELLDE